MVLRQAIQGWDGGSATQSNPSTKAPSILWLCPPPKSALSFQDSSLSYPCSKKWDGERMTEMQYTLLLKTSWILHVPSLLTSLWPDISHVATPNCKEGKKSYCILGSPAHS